ncbi:hypothetical protein BDZ89DRAFT_1066030 [Hymenopellis radicata]|nr:hypothetical protein BDZ89DRAFT_1066030 [Hymenopellis radicata]
MDPRKLRDRDHDEVFWVSHYRFLVQRGYALPSRYHPDWVPMRLKHRWRAKTTHLWFGAFEDEAVPHFLWVREAVRTSDGQRVVIKCTTISEWSALEYLTAPERVNHPENHTVPVLDSFPVPGDADGRLFVVMFFLREFDNPPFHCRKEFVHACSQIVEGFQFMHDQNVAHGDSCTKNFVMDSREVCPKGYLFARPNTVDGKARVPYIHRCRVPSPVRYYIIDFESSLHYPAGKPTARTEGARCQVKTSPEWNSDAPYNPFPLDVYNVGASFLDLCQDYDYVGLEEFIPIFRAMMASDPSVRPTFSEVRHRLDCLIATKDDVWLDECIWPAFVQQPSPRRIWEKYPRTLMLSIC